MGENREIKKIKRILKKVKSLENQMKALSDDALSGKTAEFKERYKKGESLDSLLPEAFAAIIEADSRVLGKHPYDVQIMAGIALHKGYLAEMNTGEGKTLSATMPLYLNAITGRSCFLVTTNEYLASRDGEEMSPVYQFMGLTCEFLPPNTLSEEQSDEDRKKMYQANIVYLTNGKLGFDFLFNNLIKKEEDRFMKDMYYVIIDEADAVLLDSAVMPLVVSGVPRVQSNLYGLCDFFVTTLKEGVDFICEDKAVWLTEKGVSYAESYFKIDHFYSPKNFEINRHVTLALRAHHILHNNKDYVVSDDNKINLVDAGTGRIMPGVNLRGGQHQALEMKEHLELSQETRTVASVTFQNLFLMFDKMAGMSGTITNEADEMFEIYRKKIVRIPTNRPIARVDRKDLYYPDAKNQFYQAVGLTIRVHKTGQPVLIVLETSTDTEIFSRLLMGQNIAHNVLNANNAFWEAEIIKGAGQINAVTVATSMAGRGTDIKLGEGVRELGGLAVIGVGRMSNIRTERQTRGRSGRQGDPGFSQFFVSLQDDVVGSEDNPKLEKYIDGKKRISKSRLKRIINKAQKFKEETESANRKNSVQYDRILQRQREFIYATRDNMLSGTRVEYKAIIDIARENINRFIDAQNTLDVSILTRYILDNISYGIDSDLMKLDLNNRDSVKSYLLLKVRHGLVDQEIKLMDDDVYDQFVREAVLKAVDDGWVELLDYLEQLKFAVSGRASAQRNVNLEYQVEAFESYFDAEKEVKANIIRNILLSNVSLTKDHELMVIYP